MAKTSGQGTIISISKKGSTGAMEKIGCITGWSLDAADRATIDTTCTTDTSKTFMFGLRDNGTLNVDLFWDETSPGWVLVEESYGSNDEYEFQIEYSNKKQPAGAKGTVKTFAGQVVSFSEKGGVDEVITSTVSIKLTGDVASVAPTK